jgi:chromosome segregation ATPase
MYLMYGATITLHSVIRERTMADMIEGIEDICASLGLGKVVLSCTLLPPLTPLPQVPLLNAENRALNQRLQELQIQLGRNRAKIQEDAEQVRVYKEHLATVAEATELNQELLRAKRAEIEVEEGLLRAEEVMQERLLRDKRRAAARLEELQEQRERMQQQVEEDREAVRNLEHLIKAESENQGEWAAALGLVDRDLARLATYYQADEGKIKTLSLRLVSLREKVGAARAELQQAATRSRMAHLALDKNAEEFRAAHAARQEVVRQWQGSLQLLAKRDQELEAAAGEVDRIRGVIARREIDLQEQSNFLNNEVGNNEELRREVTAKEKKAQQLREKLMVAEEEKRKYENEVTVERRQILKLSIDIDKNRTKLSKIKKDKMHNVKKLNALKLASAELENRKAISAGLVLTAEERAAAVEGILAEYERQHDTARQEVARLRERRLALEQRLAGLVRERQAADLEIKAILKEEAKTRRSIAAVKETLQKKEDILYCHEFELARLERHNGRAQGRAPEDNRQELKEELAALRERLEEQGAARQAVDGLVYRLEVSIGRCRKEIEGVREANLRTQEESGETELVIETSARQTCALKETIQELTVEDKMLSMTEIKIKDEVRALEQELVEAGRALVEEEAGRRERLTAGTAAREMHEAQARCVQQELEELGRQIQIRETRREKLQIKHDVIFASLGKLEDEQGERIPSHAYHLVKLAQEKAELKDASAVLKKKIKKEESDLRSLQKALGMIKNSNSDFRTGNLRRKTPEDSELTELTADAAARRAELQELRAAVAAAGREQERLEAGLQARDSELEAVKSACEERREVLRAAGRAVREQEVRLERAVAAVGREHAEVRRGSPSAAKDYELDMSCRLAREQQHQALGLLRDLAPAEPAIGLAVRQALGALGLHLPEIGRLTAPRPATARPRPGAVSC